MNFTIYSEYSLVNEFPTEHAENVVIGSQTVRLRSFQALCISQICCRISDMRFCVFLQNHIINRLMALLQDVLAATHHEQQQALDLQSDGSNAEKRATKDAKNEGGPQRKELVALIPNVGVAVDLKRTRHEQSKGD